MSFGDGFLETKTLILLAICLLIALGFEVVNGFHDTANAVATVIYTKALSPRKAVVWSGLCNFLGVHVGGIAVAFSIVYLLPVDLLIGIGSHSGITMVLALLTSAMLWNIGTWYFGIPVSSSHTLIGAIIGVGLVSSLFSGGGFGSGVNWAKAGEVGLSLLISPLLGFVLAGLLVLVFRYWVRQASFHNPPVGDKPPPWPVRLVLLLTCTGVSFAHGSNDGQKGIGLIMLILIGVLPAEYALNQSLKKEHIQETVQAAKDLEAILGRHEVGDGQPPDKVPGRAKVVQPVEVSANLHRVDTRGKVTSVDTLVEHGHVKELDFADLRSKLADIRATLDGKSNLGEISKEDRWRVRTDILEIDYALKSHSSDRALSLSEEESRAVADLRKRLRAATDYAPDWVPIAVAFALGIGTMIGWRRVVVTVGEKIGKTHMSYGQGAAAEIVAMGTIGLADAAGMPVSTTHVLASGVAGTMAANRSGVQAATLKSIALAWVLTLPVAMILAGALFFLFRLVVG